MKSRIDTIENPDINEFNIAMPSRRRLAIFDEICPEKSQKNKKKLQVKGWQRSARQAAWAYCSLFI